eukprot:NODE_533_length_7074_cov_0.525878.p4 type:complete len:104 gc:universal NODE_533_length_7074_cov_0.525878:3039-3350(+)
MVTITSPSPHGNHVSSIISISFDPFIFPKISCQTSIVKSPIFVFFSLLTVYKPPFNIHLNLIPFLKYPGSTSTISITYPYTFVLLIALLYMLLRCFFGWPFLL